MRNVIRKKLNRHFVTQIDIISDIHSKWLTVIQTQFGEVISEITEEQFNNGEALDEDVEKMPPVGNGTYIVTMKLRKDLPNWVPMYGRRVRFEYRGIKKQCSGCYGPHIKKFCKYDWMSMEEYK